MLKPRSSAARRLRYLLPLSLAAVTAGVALADPQLPPIHVSTSQPASHATDLFRPPPPQRDPLEVKLSPKVTEAISDPMMTEPERRALAIFHGQWANLKNLTTAETAAIAMQRWDLNNPALKDASVPALLRARAAYERGEMSEVFDLLAKDKSVQAAVLRAKAQEQLGKIKLAAGGLAQVLEKADPNSVTSAPEMSALGDALVELAALGGPPVPDTQPGADSQPAPDVHTSQEDKAAVNIYGKAYNDLDKLYYPAMVGQAAVLMEKDNPGDAVKAIGGALSLDPSCGQAWQIIGALFARTYDFQKAHGVIAKLRAVNPDHPLADELEVQTLLTERDAAGARKVLTAALARYPHRPMFMALDAAVAAAAYDKTAFDAALDRFDKAWPKNPLAYMVAGDVLSTDRQYELARRMLQTAINLQPGWSKPQVAMGLLLMQSGDEVAAHEALQRATDLNPYDLRAGNQLILVEQILKYKTIKTEHFIVKYRDDQDSVLARDMPRILEKMYAELTGIYEHRPAHTTIIEIFPDAKHFAVRITGTPEIWTIGASTGDLIAITPPRDGEGQRGAFDWVRVIRHEFVHTITLDQTHNRVPHWFTEACAVSQEPGDRDFNTSKLLADALHAHALFDLENINWGFIRPVRPFDRQLAYAQSNWMLQYLTAKWGHESIVKMLGMFRDGATTDEAILKITGQDPKEFMAKFTDWATAQVRQWGLGPPPKYDQRTAELLSHPNAVDGAVLAELLTKYPDEPGLLEIAAHRAVAAVPAAPLAPEDAHLATEARQAILRYAQARPVDPWSQTELLTLASKDGHPEDAQGALEYLDRQEQTSGAYAQALADLYRGENHLDLAAQYIQRALDREPYNPSYRELAATIALQRGDDKEALFQLQDLPILEPEVALDQVRLAVLYHRMNMPAEAKIAAQAALKLDPNPDPKVKAALDECMK